MVMDNYLFDPEESAEEKINKRDQQKRIDNDLLSVMTTDSGRRFIWRLLENSQVFSTSFSPDPYLTAFNEGCRNFGLEIFAELHRVCPELYALMANEAREQQEKQ